MKAQHSRHTFDRKMYYAKSKNCLPHLMLDEVMPTLWDRFGPDLGFYRPGQLSARPRTPSICQQIPQHTSWSRKLYYFKLEMIPRLCLFLPLHLQRVSKRSQVHERCDARCTFTLGAKRSETFLVALVFRELLSKISLGLLQAQRLLNRSWWSSSRTQWQQPACPLPLRVSRPSLPMV